MLWPWCCCGGSSSSASSGSGSSGSGSSGDGSPAVPVHGCTGCRYDPSSPVFPNAPDAFELVLPLYGVGATCEGLAGTHVLIHSSVDSCKWTKTFTSNGHSIEIVLRFHFLLSDWRTDLQIMRDGPSGTIMSHWLNKNGNVTPLDRDDCMNPIDIAKDTSGAFQECASPSTVTVTPL